MRLSLKVEYACRVLARLARTQGSEQWWHIEELARLEAVPANYLVQILNELRRSGLIVSRRGKQGGYALAKPPADVTLREVVEGVDPDLLTFNLAGQGESGPRVAKVWREVATGLAEDLAARSLQDFLPGDGSGMYWI